MERWREVWREAIVPLLSTNSLVALRWGIMNNDHRLIRGTTVYPIPVSSNADETPVSACAIGYCGWQGEGLNTVAEVEEFFARMCIEIDTRMNEPAGCRWWLNWFDSTPKEEVWREMLHEIDLALEGRVIMGDEPSVVTDK